MLIDTHCHLTFPDFQNDLSDIIQLAQTNEVNTLITIATDIPSSIHAIQLAEQYPQIYAAIGIHPSEVHSAPKNAYDQLKQLAQHPKVVAIGECGLDYHYLPSKTQNPDPQHSLDAYLMQSPTSHQLQIADDQAKNQQHILFKQQLDLAVELNLNVIVHQRDSWQDTIDVIQPYHGKLKAVFHCFTGSTEDALQLIQHNHLVSFTGIVTFKNARQTQQTATQIPSNSFMLETDSPYLAPTPHRGKRCEPAHTRIVAQKIAELRNTTLQEIAHMTTITAQTFFKKLPTP